MDFYKPVIVVLIALMFTFSVSSISTVYGYVIEQEQNRTNNGTIHALYCDPSYITCWGENRIYFDAPWRVNPTKQIEVYGIINLEYDIKRVILYDDINENIVAEKVFGDILSLNASQLPYVLNFSVDPNSLSRINNHIRMKMVFTIAGIIDYNRTEGPLEIIISNETLPTLKSWYYGDTHYHSSYTFNEVELGGPLPATIKAMNAMGLDWVTVTDHSFTLKTGEKWNAFKAECNSYPNCLIGEEISCDNDGPLDYNHYLGYNISDRIYSGEFLDNGTSPLPCSEVVDRVNAQGGFGYAAHPFYREGYYKDGFGLAYRNIWQNYSLPFTGMEIWNHEDAIDELEQGIKKWQELLLSGRRIFIEAGSDAHGDFNRDEYGSLGTGMGKVRTACFAENFTKDNIFSALKSGNCMMTDGPIIVFTAENADNFTQEYNPGESFQIRRRESARLKILWNSTGEFGNVANISLIRGDIGGNETTESVFYPDNLSGDIEIISRPKNSYYRLEGNSRDSQGNIRRAYTNPIWIERKIPVPSISLKRSAQKPFCFGWSIPEEFTNPIYRLNITSPFFQKIVSLASNFFCLGAQNMAQENVSLSTYSGRCAYDAYDSYAKFWRTAYSSEQNLGNSMLLFGSGNCRSGNYVDCGNYRFPFVISGSGIWLNQSGTEARTDTGPRYVSGHAGANYAYCGPGTEPTPYSRFFPFWANDTYSDGLLVEDNSPGYYKASGSIRNVTRTLEMYGSNNYVDISVYNPDNENVSFGFLYSVSFQLSSSDISAGTIGSHAYKLWEDGGLKILAIAESANPFYFRDHYWWFSLPSSSPNLDTYKYAVISTNESFGTLRVYFYPSSANNTEIIQNASQALIADGLFTINLVAEDGYGESPAVTSNFTIDTKPPNLTVSASANLSGTGNVTIRITADERAIIPWAKIRQGNCGLSDIGLSTYDNLTYLANYTVREGCDGELRLLARPADDLGNTAPQEYGSIMSVDTTPPRIVKSFSNSSSIGGFVSFSAEDPNFASFLYSIDGGANSSEHVGEWIDIYYMLKRGWHTIDFFANDTLGHAVAEQNSIYILNHFPQPAAEEVYITVNETDVVNVTIPIYDFDNDTVEYFFFLPFNSTGQWQTTYDNAGEYYTEVLYRDDVSRGISGYDVYVTVLNVNRVPEIRGFYPLNNSVFQNNSTINVSVNATDADGDALNYSIMFDNESISNSSNASFFISANSENHTITFNVSDNESSVLLNVLVRFNVTKEEPAPNITQFLALARGEETGSPFVSKNRGMKFQLASSLPSGFNITIKRGDEIIGGWDTISYENTALSPEGCEWLGKTGACEGDFLPDGNYSLSLVALSAAGKISGHFKKQIYVDNTPPAVSIHSPQNKIYASTDISLDFSAADEFLESVWYEYNGTNVTLRQNTTFIPLANQESVLILYANDSAGNLNSAHTKIVTDTIPPQILFVSGTETDNAYVSRNWIYANVSLAEANFENISFYIYNSTSIVNSTTYTGYVGPVNWTDLPEGKYFFSASVFDLAGNKNATETKSETLDRTAPFILIIFPQNASYSSKEMTLNYTAEDTNPDRVWYQYNGTNITLSGNTSFNALENQNSVLVIYANDTAGNTNSASVSFATDILPPVVTVLQPENITYNSPDSIPLNISVSEAYEWCGYSLNRDPNTTFVPNTTIAVRSAPAGQHVQVFCNDTAGNVGESYARHFSLSLNFSVKTAAGSETDSYSFEGTGAAARIYNVSNLGAASVSGCNISFGNRTNSSAPLGAYAAFNESNISLQPGQHKIFRMALSNVPASDTPYFEQIKISCIETAAVMAVEVSSKTLIIFSQPLNSGGGGSGGGTSSFAAPQKNSTWNRTNGTVAAFGRNSPPTRMPPPEKFALQPSEKQDTGAAEGQTDKSEPSSITGFFFRNISGISEKIRSLISWILALFRA